MRIPPLVIAGVAAAGAWGLARAIPAAAFDIPGRRIAAVAIAAAGLAVGVMGVTEFRRARTTVNPLRPEGASHLVASGVYRRTRNPMYLGVAVVLLAWGVWLGNWAAALAGPAAFGAWMNVVQIPAEERALERVFGQEYQAYRRRVRRWL